MFKKKKTNKDQNSTVIKFITIINEKAHREMDLYIKLRLYFDNVKIGGLNNNIP